MLELICTRMCVFTRNASANEYLHWLPFHFRHSAARTSHVRRNRLRQRKYSHNSLNVSDELMNGGDDMGAADQNDADDKDHYCDRGNA